VFPGVFSSSPPPQIRGAIVGSPWVFTMGLTGLAFCEAIPDDDGQEKYNNEKDNDIH
jgi:hypothetical protein